MKEPAVEAYGFDAVFGSALDLAYQGSTIDEINKHRRSLENELFFDRLLKAIGIEQGMMSSSLDYTACKTHGRSS